MPVLYEAPLMLERSHLSDIVCRELHLDCPHCDLTDWNEMLARIAARRRSVNIAIVGKYTKLHDAYPVSYTHLGDAPVVVLAAAVHAVEGLFMQ